MKTYLKTDLSYAAGFLDGEGCFYIGHNREHNTNRWRTQVQVTQCNEDVLLFMSAMFGGSVHKRKPGKIDRKTVYLWTVSTRLAHRMVKLLYPYLRVKKKQAELFLEMTSRKIENGSRRISEREISDRRALIYAMRVANNQRGMFRRQNG